MFNITPLKNGLENVEGFFCGGVNSGIKSSGINDLGFIRSDENCAVSALFTQNRFKAAPICHFLNYKKDFKTNFILLNSKNANAMTGKKGIEDIDEILLELNKKFPSIKNPIMSSTGVIGERLNKKR